MRARLLLLFIIALIANISTARAATYTWTGLVNSNWNNSTNWSAFISIPGAGDAVIIPATAPFFNNPTVNVASSCASITITGTTTITLSANLTVSGALTVNNGNTLTTAGTSAATFGGSSSISGALIVGATNSITFNSGASLTVNNGGSFTNNATGANSVTFNTATFGLSGGSTFTNSGNVNLNTTSPLTSGNPVTITNSSGANITATSSNITFNGGTTVNNSGTISVTSATVTAGNPVPITNSSTGVITITSTTLNLQGGAYINNSGAVSVLKGTSASTVNFSNPSYINNLTGASSLTVTGSNLAIGAGGYLTNSGTITTSATSTIGLNGNPTSITNNVNSHFNANATTFTLVAGATITNTGANFSAISCPFNVSGNPSSITNQNSGATIGSLTFDNCPITFNGTNSLINYGTVTAYHGTTINMASGGTISNITNYGTFYAGTSGSPCTITISGSQSTINNSSTTVGATTYYGYFFVGPTSSISLGGNLSSVNNAASCTFTLLSDNTGTGTLGAINTGATGYNGTYNVQRYISGGAVKYRGYRLFSSPVYAGSDANSNHIYSLNFVQASSLVTGLAGGGFDKTGNPSLYLFRENIAVSNVAFTSGNFRAISTLLTAPTYSIIGDAGTYSIPVGNGFLFFFRGDRTSNLANKYTPGTSAETVTMTTTGTLNQGQVTVHDWYTASSANLGFSATAGNGAVRGYNFVGNPYPSSIDWETFQTASTTTGIYGTPGALTGVVPTIWVFNVTTQNYGAYVKGGGGVGTNSATNIVASGQGFFVQAQSTTDQLIFNETAKTNTQATGGNLLMGKPDEQTANSQYLRLQLAKDTVNTDDLLLRFNSSAATTYTPGVDALYKPGFGAVSISSLSGDNLKLAINVQPLPKTSSTIGITVSANADGIYSLNMKDLVGVPQLFDIWLMDAYKKDSLDMRHNPTYSFNILKSDTNSFGTKRFSLVLRQNPAYAYRLLNFTATKAITASPQVQVIWLTENEQNYTHFTVERSLDSGKTYNVLNSETSSAQGTYSFLDQNPSTTVQNFYRLKQEDINGSITYSAIIPVAFSNKSNTLLTGNINVYPNPATSTINLAITSGTNTAVANYNIQITNSSGLVIKQATSAQSSWQSSVADLVPGTYILKVINTKDNTLVGNTKFVKL